MTSQLRYGVPLLLLLAGCGIASAQPVTPPSGYLVLSEAQEQLLWQMVGARTTKPVSARQSFDAPLDGRVAKSVGLHPMPPDVIAQLPTLQGYSYANVGANLLVVNPVDRSIVDVITPLEKATAASQ